MATNKLERSPTSFKKINPIVMRAKTTGKMFTTTHRTLSIFRPSDMVIMFSVVVLICNKKILNTIVKFIVVNVMNNFIRFKISFNFLLHDKSMLSNIAQGSGIRMIGTINKSIASFIDIRTTLPSICLVAFRQIFKIAPSAHFSFISSFVFRQTRILHSLFTVNAVFNNHNLIISQGGNK